MVHVQLLQAVQEPRKVRQPNIQPRTQGMRMSCGSFSKWESSAGVQQDTLQAPIETALKFWGLDTWG